MNSDNRERCRILMMAEIDGEISAEEREELRTLLKRYPELSQEFEQFTRMKEVMDHMQLEKPKDDIWKTYWFNVYHRLERGLAWFLFTLGACIVFAYGLFRAVLGIWADADIPLIIKIGIFSVILGAIILLISVIREKVFLSRRERYKEVQR
jgi:hypothetical protein